MYYLRCAIYLAKPLQGADKPYFSVHELSWEVLFFFFLCIHGNNPGAVLVSGKQLHTKTSLSVGKRYLPMDKRASVTTTNVSQVRIPDSASYAKLSSMVLYSALGGFFPRNPVFRCHHRRPMPQLFPLISYMGR